MSNFPQYFYIQLIFSIAMMTCTATSSYFPQVKETHIHLYFHEVFQGAPNATSYVVASLTHSPSANFGAIYVFDNALTQGKDPNSKLIGRAQGISAIASLHDTSLLVIINYVFTDGKYKGSTLTTAGRVDGLTGHTEHNVLGGSGKFRMARGYALSKQIRALSNNTHLLVQFDFYVKHY